MILEIPAEEATGGDGVEVLRSRVRSASEGEPMVRMLTYHARPS